MDSSWGPNLPALTWAAPADLDVASLETGLAIEKTGSQDTGSLSKPLSNLCPPVVAYEVRPPVHNFKNISKKLGSNHDFISSHKYKCVHSICFKYVRYSQGKRGGGSVAMGDGWDNSKQMPLSWQQWHYFMYKTKCLPPDGRTGGILSNP